MAVEKQHRRFQGRRAYGEAGTSVPRERVWSEPPSRHAEDEGPGEGQRYECPRRILRTVPAAGPSAHLRPREKNGGGKVTTAKAGKYRPSKILTPFQQSVWKPT